MEQKDLPVVLLTGSAKKPGTAITADLAIYGFTAAVHYSQSAYETKTLCKHIATDGGYARASQLGCAPFLSEFGQTNRHPSVTGQILLLMEASI